MNSKLLGISCSILILFGLTCEEGIHAICNMLLFLSFTILDIDFSSTDLIDFIVNK